MGETITIHRATVGAGVDEQGNPNPGTATTITSHGWAVAPSNEAEDQETFGVRPVTGLTLYNRAIVAVLPTDEVTVRGDRYKVAGESAEWVHPRVSLRRGTVISVERVA